MRRRNDDSCCRHCRTPFAGVCREHHECWCHYQNRREYKEGRYTVPDPTGNKAVHNVMTGRDKRTR